MADVPGQTKAPGDNAAPADAAAREHAVAATGSVLVQAPAGSGKTTLLAQRYLRLLATVEAPERILALTFTRRAAQEMRERVLRALQSGSSGLGVAAKRHMDRLGFDLERHPSRLRIETIDAFNAWLAAQLPITAGAGSRLNLIETPRPLYEEAARRTLAYEVADPFGQAVERVLAQGDQRWQSLVDLIAGMLPSRDRWLPLLAGHLRASSALDEAQLQLVRRHLDEDLRLLVARALGVAAEAIGGERLEALSMFMHAAALRVENPDAGMLAWRANPATLRPDTGDIARWRGVANTLLTNDATYRKRLTKNEGFPPQCDDKTPMMNLIDELDRKPAVLRALMEIRTLPAPAYDDDQWARVREVAQVLVLAAAQLDHVFRESGTVDFPAVSMAALRALGTATAPTDLSLRLDYRLQHILVDEFQDTSSAQLELVKLLTAGWQRGDGRSIFCVGDPMQSIYGFRQAEVRAFLELADDGIGEVRFDVERLRSNFRSAKPVVDWINACFSRVLPRTDDRERGAIAFRPSEAARHDVSVGASTTASVSTTANDSTAADAAVTLRGFASRRDEADAIAALIAERCTRHPDWRIVILVRAKAHAREIANSLRSRAIAFRAVDIEPLQDRPPVRDLVMLICALLHLGDRTAWLALLRAPWVGLTLADLLCIARSGPVIWDALQSEPVLAELSEEGRIRCARFRDTLEAAFRVRTQGTFTRWVEQTWLALGGPSWAAAADLDHFRAVFARLRQLEQRGLPDPADLVQSFDDLYAEHRAASGVEIMTIHKAKGLEFDMVVVPALDRHIPLHRDQLLLSHQFSRGGRDGLVIAARPGVGEEPDPLFGFLRCQARDASALEAERLLYVACTRAKWRLHLTATVGTLDQPDEAADDTNVRSVWKPRIGSLLAVLWPVVGAGFALDQTRTPAHDAGEVAPRGGPLCRVPRDWSPAHENAVLVSADLGGAVALREETPVFDWAGETARRVGSLVHGELQVLDLDRSDAAGVQARDAHFRRWLALHGVPAERLQDASARVIAALTAVHGDPRARWILRKRARDDVREHALSGRGQSGIVRVIFDRSFIDEQGVRWVIDYKTSHHAGGNLEEFLDREVERYRAQLHRYAELARRLGPEPVRVGLYFPLMAAWREWEP
ncbi:MAG: UvrD-helicase domain-containing protein [Pseudomonadota bacterium]|nr:UvrD-helicase domain-containing protein [Pseudomonadota bacterium]